MSKDKKLRKIVIDKLFHKNQNFMKQSTRSNAPTQSTPNQPKNFSKTIQNFFQNFQTQCAIIYETVILKDHCQLKRSLQQQLHYLSKNEKKSMLKVQEYQPINYINYKKNQSCVLQNKDQVYRKYRLQTQNNNCLQNFDQLKTINTDAKKQNLIKSQSMIFSSYSNCQNPLYQKYKKEITESKQKYQTLVSRNQKIKIITNQKQPLNGVKQENLFQTNTKYMPSKYIQKNAPIKNMDKPQKADRIKRIQSLKNLNQNGPRKYSYRREY